MVRIISKSLMALALAGFLIPSITSDADAGRRYKSNGKYHGNSVRQGHRYRRNGGFLLRIPASYLNRQFYKPTDFSNRSYRGGPKIIDVQKTLRARRKRELQD
jgi:hypothetical protein